MKATSNKQWTLAITPISMLGEKGAKENLAL